MTVKFAYFNDLHIRSTVPKARKECDFLQEGLDDLEYVLKHCKDNKINYALFAGDLFDTYNQTARSLSKVGQLLQKYKDSVEVVACLGNHDIKNRNPDSYLDETSIGILQSFGLITILVNGDCFHIDENVAVYGFGSDDETTEKLLKTNKVNPSKNDRFSIALIHYPIGDENCGFTSMSVENIKTDTDKWDLLLFGDIHDFVTFNTIKTAYVCSNGGLCKKSLSDLGRDKQFSVFELTEDRELRHEFIKVPCFSDEIIFNLQQYEDRDATEAKMFTAAMIRTKLRKQVSPLEKVEAIASKGSVKFSTEAKNEVVKRLKEYVD